MSLNLGYPGSLHNHSDYSNIRLRDCINKVPDLFKTAKECGHSIVALTDHETTSGWIQAEKLKKDFPDLKIVLGNEIYLCRNGLNSENYNKDYDRYYHFILLAKDLIGAHQIMEISSRAWMRSYMSRAMRRVPTYYNDLFEVIGKNPGHIIGSTACLGGAIPVQLLRYRATKDEVLKEKIIGWLNRINSLFGEGNFYLELQPSNNNDQVYVNKALKTLSKELNIPYIITTDSHYLRKEDRVVHKAYLNAQDGDREVDEFYASTYMMNTEELESYFKYFTKEELQVAYRNIENIGKKIEDYSIRKPLKIPSLKWKPVLTYYTEYPIWFERIPMLKTFYESEYKSDKYLVNAIIDGIYRHPDLNNQDAFDEINACLEDTWVSSNVNNARWSAYYLNLQNIIDACWEAGSLVGAGRGSGVGFVLLYCLDITQINPLREKTRTFRWRFLNPERVSVLDIDFDTEGRKRQEILKKFREVYGEDRVANVATFRTEKPKMSITTAARGLGIAVDTARYISSLIPVDRGAQWTLDQTYYGDEEHEPVKQFINVMNTYPELWQVAHKIEGLISGSGIHAGGVIFVDEPFENSCALMRAPDGTICTQFELHAAEEVSLIKYDALSVEALDKIHICLDLLVEHGFIKQKDTLKETYEDAIGIYNLERDNPDMWKMVWNHEIPSLFQMEKQSGIAGIAALKPTNVDDLAILNSTIRLMAQEKGAEMPTDKLARFKANPNLWLEEMKSRGLGEKELEILAPVLSISYGLCIAQEQFMELVQMPELGGFTLTWADKLRKSIAKKNPKEYNALTEEYFKICAEKGINPALTDYVWNTLIAMSRGYGFNQSHTLAYSLIGLQEMNLAYRFPIIFWSCACLISDAGGEDEPEDEEEELPNCVEENYYNEMEEFGPDDKDEDVEDSYEEEDCDGYPAEVVVLKNGKKKKKVKATNYGRIATAIGKMESAGIIVAPPDINKSGVMFSPDYVNSVIRYGLNGITRISADLIKEIIKNRPYESLNDFMNKVKTNKLQMINLIKSGAFDEFGKRTEIMNQYLYAISDRKEVLNLRNMAGLIKMNLLPEELSFEIKVFNFNKYIRKSKEGDVIYLDSVAMRFYSENFSMDDLKLSDKPNFEFMIKEAVWKKVYDKYMNKPRDYIKAHQKELLDKVNEIAIKEQRDKYAQGTISKWEMDSISFYSHEHELANVKLDYYGVVDFFSLSEEPEVERVIPIKGHLVPLYRIFRIAGTVLDRDKNKKTVSLLTNEGVVSVSIFGPVFSTYDKQISEVGEDGHKHVKEKSWLSRGQKIIITGIRRGESFYAKKYKGTPYHLVELITDVAPDGTIITKQERDEMA